MGLLLQQHGVGRRQTEPSPGRRALPTVEGNPLELPYWRMEPANQLAIGACASPSREVYACYSDGAGEVLPLLRRPPRAGRRRGYLSRPRVILISGAERTAKANGLTPGPCPQQQPIPGPPFTNWRGRVRSAMRRRCSSFARELREEDIVKYALLRIPGEIADRFCEYQDPLSIEQKLEHLVRIPGVTGAEVVHPTKWIR